MPKLKAGTILPAPAEDAAITAAAMADPDAIPFTDAEWSLKEARVSKAFSSIKRGLLQAIEHAENHAPQPDKQQFASVWDALADTPEEAASMKARSARRMALARFTLKKP